MYGDRSTMAWINSLKSFLNEAEAQKSSKGFTYGLNLSVFGFYTIKTPLTSPSSVHFQCFLSFLYSSSTTYLLLSHPLFFLLCRMNVKECRKKGIYNIGFMDPHVIHEDSVQKWPNRVENHGLG